MHCQSCVAKLTAALSAVPGVIAADVSLDPPMAELKLSSAAPPSFDTLNRAAQSAGNYRLSESTSSAPPSGLVQLAPNRAAAQHTEHQAAAEAPRESLFPLALIVGYLVLAVALIAMSTAAWQPATLMRHFMAGFFLVFSFFKLLNLRGFVDSYRMYDLVARSVAPWAFAYPFIELALGVAYVLDVYPFATNVVTLALMLVGALGVLLALRQKKSIRCACLGSVLNLPMTTVTLVEDLTMAAMAAAMLVV
jgi:copper chaperone CopZ